MAKRNLVLEGDDTLRKHSREVTEYNEKLWQLLDDMTETMHANDGVGLAAVQVGVLRRVVVIDVGDEKGVYELINPEIVEVSGEQTGNEGCLSFPGEWGTVTRPMRVRVKAADRHGNERILEGEGLLARAFCHEVDHLDGILFVDHAKEVYREAERPKRRWRRAK